MQTTAVRVRVSDPTGEFVEGAVVDARLMVYGVDPVTGFIDRTRVIQLTDKNGEVTLNLWPSKEGTTGSEYKITARNSDGSKLFEHLVTVPESDVPVWLQDILLLPPPSKKPYDEAAIDAIIENRILSAKARDEAVAAAESATASEAVVVAAEEAVLAAQVDVAANAAAAAVSEANAKASELAAQAAAEAAEGSNDGVADAIGAAQASADSANSSAILANKAATAAYKAANDVSEALVDLTEIVDSNTAKANQSITDISNINVKLQEIDPLTADVSNLKSKTQSMQAELDELPDTFASPEQIEALQTQVTGLQTDFDASGIAGILFSVLGKDLVSKETKEEVLELLGVTGGGGGSDLVGQSDPLDATSGRALLVGAFGLGGMVQDVAGGVIHDPALKTGFYTTSTTQSTPIGQAYKWMVIHLGHDTAPLQLWFSQDPIRTFVRRGNVANGPVQYGDFVEFGAGGGDVSVEIDQLQTDVASLQTRVSATESGVNDARVDATEAKGTANSALSLSQQNSADIEALQNAGGSGSDSRVDAITPTGWSVVSAANQKAARDALGIVDSETVFAKETDLNALEDTVATVQTSLTSTNEKAVAAKTAADAAQVTADEGFAKASQLEQEFADSDVSSLRTQVQSLDTNVDSLNIRVDQLDGDGSVDMPALQAKVDSFTPLGLNIARSQDTIAARTHLELGDAAVKSVQEFKDDKTPGKLMSTGAFGIGGHGIAVNTLSDPALVDGIYTITSSTSSDPASLPLGTGDYSHYVVLHMGYDDGRSVQISFSISDVAPRMFIRRSHFNEWSGWSEPGGGFDPAALEAEIDAVSAVADSALTKANQANDRIDALPASSSSALGNTLTSKTTTAEMRTVLELGTAAVKAAQTSSTDTTAGSLMQMGAFGLGSGGSGGLGHTVPPVSIDYTTMPSGLYTFTKGGNAGTFPGTGGSSTTQYGLLHLNGGQFSKGGLQFCVTEYNGSSIYARKATGANGWSTWQDILAPILPAMFGIDSDIMALVTSTTGGTLLNGLYNSIPGSGLTLCALDGVTTKVQTLSGTWRQMSYADFTSADPAAKVALFKRIA